MNERKWLFRILVLSFLLIVGQACTTNINNEFSPIKEKGKTLLPNLNVEKFVPENSLGGDTKTKTGGGNTTIDWHSIEKLLAQAQDQTEAELIAVFSVRDSLGVWYNYYLQPLGFSPKAMEEANGKTQIFIYELNKDDAGSVPRIAVAIIPEGEQAFKEMEHWILPRVETEPEQEKLKTTCEYVKVAPEASVCWRGGCTYYPAIYEWQCNGGGSSDPSWNWPDDGSGSGGSGSGGSEPGKDGTNEECLPPYVDIGGECVQPCQTGEPALDDPDVSEKINDLWEGSNFSGNQFDRKEQGGWIIKNPTTNDYSFQEFPSSWVRLACKIEPSQEFTLPSNVIGVIHTHPFSTGEKMWSCLGLSESFINQFKSSLEQAVEKYENTPSPDDIMFLNDINQQTGLDIDGYIIDESGVIKYDKSTDVENVNSMSKFDRCNK